MHFQPPYNEMKCAHLLTVRLGAVTPPTPPYGQPDRKIPVFFKPY